MGEGGRLGRMCGWLDAFTIRVGWMKVLLYCTVGGRVGMFFV